LIIALQAIFQAIEDVWSSLAFPATLLISPQGLFCPIMDWQGQQNAISEDRPGHLTTALLLLCLNSAGVWLLYQVIKWISV